MSYRLTRSKFSFLTSFFNIKSFSQVNIMQNEILTFNKLEYILLFMLGYNNI